MSEPKSGCAADLTKDAKAAPKGGGGQLRNPTTTAPAEKTVGSDMKPSKRNDEY